MSQPIPGEPGHGAFLSAVLAGDRAGALREARHHLSAGLECLYDDVLRPALIEVGERWHRNELTVADEHLATALTQATIASLYAEVPWPRGGPRALVVCVEGERHELGARMVADLLALDGWDDRFLGSDTPVDEVVRAARELGPRLVGLSITLPQSLPAARRTVMSLRAALPGVRILVGGRALAGRADAAETLGADAHAATAREAVHVARPWKREA